MSWALFNRLVRNSFSLVIKCSSSKTIPRSGKQQWFSIDWCIRQNTSVGLRTVQLAMLICVTFVRVYKLQLRLQQLLQLLLLSWKLLAVICGAVQRDLLVYSESSTSLNSLCDIAITQAHNGGKGSHELPSELTKLSQAVDLKLITQSFAFSCFQILSFFNFVCIQIFPGWYARPSPSLPLSSMLRMSCHLLI